MNIRGNKCELLVIPVLLGLGCWRCDSTNWL